MSKPFKIILTLILILIIFNKPIITFYYTNKFSKWVDKEVTYKRVKIDYPNSLIILDLKILNEEKFKNDYLFKSKKIQISVDIGSLLKDDLVIIKSLKIDEPSFYLNLIQKRKGLSENVSFEDNIGIAEKINENMPDKVWPPKKKDKNFLIEKVFIHRGEANIYIDNTIKETNIKLSDMRFSNIGNEKNYKHYKDTLKLILFDIINRTKDIEIKNKLKKI